MENCNRYLIDFNLEKLESECYDVVIVGAGIAGLYTALNLPPELKILIIAKEEAGISNTALAQGGIAVSIGIEDSPNIHFEDTLFAGAGLCDEEAVWLLVKQAKENVNQLVKMGVNFDRDAIDNLSLTKEGAHSINRIIHSGDTTGKAVLDTLLQKVISRSNIDIKTRIFALDIIEQDNECMGILIYNMDTFKYSTVIAPTVVFATGGYGQLYSSTTNPEVSTGDGVAIALRAGVTVVDLEFIQFHPTVLYHPMKSGFLISEALRGEGALLKNNKDERFMSKYHPLLELAPRDVVARAIFNEMMVTSTDNVYLDFTQKETKYISKRFPNIYKTLLELGIDISKDYIPVAPAEHYCMGGIKTDVNGKTSLLGLYACGECASSGIHGANRLASNSLLEGLVFGKIIANNINADSRVFAERKQIRFSHITQREENSEKFSDIEKNLKRIMTEYVGIIRSEEGLIKARNEIKKYDNFINNVTCTNLKSMELKNMLMIAKIVVESALSRKESRGAHYRSDFPKNISDIWKKHITFNIHEGFLEEKQ